VNLAVADALQGLLYFAVALIALAVLLMVRFFVMGRRKARELTVSVQQIRNGPG